MSALTPHPGEASPFDAIRQTRDVIGQALRVLTDRADAS